jgi:acetoin:2,6-dichlorophenolindophenol oxidoreductase subunit beta
MPDTRGTAVREMTYGEALSEGLHEEMERDPTVFNMGEDVEMAYVYGVTKGTKERFGPDRTRDTPMSENGLVGAAVGAALTGTRPVLEIMFSNLLALCMDQIYNEASMIRYYSGGQVKRLPLVIRAPMGIWKGYGSTHSSAIVSWYMHIPGIRVVTPATPADAKGLLKTCIRDDNPTIFLEHNQLYKTTGPVPEGEHLAPLGKSDVKRRGDDVTIVTYSSMVLRCLEAADRLEAEGISAEVIDLRTLAPLDLDPAIDSLNTTGRMVIVEEDARTCGAGAEIAAQVSDVAFDMLDAPVQRVAALDTPIPVSPVLEDVVYPTVDKIVAATKAIL